MFDKQNVLYPAFISAYEQMWPAKSLRSYGPSIPP